MDRGKERFLRNYIAIKKFAREDVVPVKNLWDFINAIANLFYNFRREKIVRYVRSQSPSFKCFMRKNVALTKRERLFKQITATIKSVLIHLLNEKILNAR